MSSSRRRSRVVAGLGWGLAAPAGIIAIHAYAADYLSVPQAQKLMFPQATAFHEQPANIMAVWLRNASAKSADSFDHVHATVWEVRQGDTRLGWFVTDAVIGKFEKINYAVALSPDGKILHVEVLSYRESHGQQVRNRDWLAQFEGKNAAAPIRLDQDIRNITDATLSCSHLTDGVRRIAQLVAANLGP